MHGFSGGGRRAPRDGPARPRGPATAQERPTVLHKMGDRRSQRPQYAPRGLRESPEDGPRT
eukprot:2090399-Pyramimonas_sp.AAC.1